MITIKIKKKHRQRKGKVRVHVVVTCLQLCEYSSPPLLFEVPFGQSWSLLSMFPGKIESDEVKSYYFASKQAS